jgi:hypothetical protein
MNLPGFDEVLDIHIHPFGVQTVVAALDFPLIPT